MIVRLLGLTATIQIAVGIWVLNIVVIIKIMETIELRESDKRRAVNLNRKNGYGLDSKQMMRLINNHKKGDAYKCALIEFRLTDINFHREVEMLMNGKYDELKEQVKQW